MKKMLKLNIKAAESLSKEVNSSIHEINKNQEELKAQCNHISGCIYLSSYKKAMDHEYLKNNEFTHIVNCAPKSKNFEPIFFEEFEYKTFDIKDEPGYDLGSVLFKFIEFLEKLEEENSNKVNSSILDLNTKDKPIRVLVHCFEGISRGPALIIGYLMWKNKLTFEQALNMVKSKRPCVDLNLGFCSQLSKWSEILNLDKELRLYRIDEMDNLRISNKNDIKPEELIKSSAVMFFKNGILHNLVLKSCFNQENCNFSFLMEIVKKYEKCNSICGELDFNVEKHCKMNFEEMFNCCF